MRLIEGSATRDAKITKQYAILWQFQTRYRFAWVGIRRSHFGITFEWTPNVKAIGFALFYGVEFGVRMLDKEEGHE